MKYLLALIFLFTGCGQDPSVNGAVTGSVGACASDSVVGVWRPNTGPSDVLTLRADCTGYQERCNSTFTWTRTGTAATVTVTDMSFVEGCLLIGTHQCEVDVSGNNLWLRCGIGQPWSQYYK